MQPFPQSIRVMLCRLGIGLSIMENYKDSLPVSLFYGNTIANEKRFFLFESLPYIKIKQDIPDGISCLMVHRKGLEPPTLGTGIRCSIH